MHKFVSFNGDILPASESSIGAATSAAMYGRGVFTTLAVRNANPVLWERHWMRLTENAVRIGIDVKKFNEETVQNAIEDLVSANEFQQGRARITFFDESSGGIWTTDGNHRTSLLITSTGPSELPDKLRLTLSPYPINSASPLAGIKSCNYLENILALEVARRQGFDEAIRLNERGEITSAAMANIFWIKGDAIFTPGLETGCLPGITRSLVIEAAGQLGIELHETKSGLSSLSGANCIFLTSSGIGARLAHFQNTLQDQTKYFDEIKKIIEWF